MNRYCLRIRRRRRAAGRTGRRPRCRRLRRPSNCVFVPRHWAAAGVLVATETLSTWRPHVPDVLPTTSRLQTHDTPSMQASARAQPLGSGAQDPQNLDGPPQLFDEECDYRYVTACSARNWVYHPHFVLYNNLHQGIGPLTLKTWLRPWASAGSDTSRGPCRLSSDLYYTVKVRQRHRQTGYMVLWFD